MAVLYLENTIAALTKLTFMLLNREFTSPWSTASKLFFRFAFCYLSLYLFLTFTSALFATPFKWLGETLLNIDYEYSANGRGSGDNTYAYVTLFANVLLAVLAWLVWSVLDRKRQSYNKMLYWFLVVLRIYIVFFMIVYGFAKVFQTQFPQPSLVRLLQPLKDFSPMGLAWTYMGYSRGFNLFTGLLEVIAGLLLIPRRTITLGSLMTAGVMIHVAAMNYMYDIPVKLFSTHLVLMALFIFSTDAKRVINLFFLNKTAHAITPYKPVDEPFYNKFILGFKILVTLLFVGLFSWQGITTEETRGHKRVKPYLYGIWEANYVIKNKDTLLPLVTDANRWQYLIIDYKDRAITKTMTGVRERFDFLIDSTTNTLTLKKKEDTITDKNFRFKHPNPLYLELEGVLDSDSIKAIFSRVDETEFTLNKRGFNWINERPYNR